MANIYNYDLLTVSHSLREFTVRANNLYDDNATDDAFIRFVLTGEFVDEAAEIRQAFVDPIQNAVDQDHPLKISRDYDSLLGIADKILVNADISVFAVPHSSFGLSTGIHLKHEIIYQGAIHQVEYHKVPNFEFGTWGTRHHLNIFFPKLWSPERSGGPKPYRMTERERDFWYRNGMRPAISTLLGENIAAQWPATCETERIRAQRSTGGFSWGTKLIPKHAVELLADQIREELGNNLLIANDDRNAWAGDFFVLHTIRGAKDTSFHRADAASADRVLREFMQEAQLVWDATEHGKWYIDVGIEIISEEDACLQWMTLGHADVVQQALHVGDDRAAAITEIGAKGYSRDLVSHLTAVSGFRLVPGRRAQETVNAVYVQAYTTDKSVVYNTDGGHHAKFLTAREAMSSEQPSKTIEGLYTIYEEAVKNNSSNARLEVRVPFRLATDVLLQFNPDTLRNCLSTFTRQEWWCFRLTRLLAISQTLSLQAHGQAAQRLCPEALTLTAACIWLVNGLHARPEDGPASRRLMDSALPLTEAEGLSRDVLAYNTSVNPHAQEEEEDSDGGVVSDRARVPYNPHGCVFFRRMMIGDVPRLRIGGPVLAGPAFRYWFTMSLEEVSAKYLRTGIIDKKVVALRRATTSKRRMPLYVAFGEEPEPTLFNLRAQHTLPPPIVDDGSDVEDRPTPPPDEPPHNIDTFLSQLWRQFVVDVISKSPNPKGAATASYVKLTSVQRREGKEDIYKNNRLSDLFTAVAYKTGSPAEWDRGFKWLFPPSGTTTSSGVQAYPHCPYYKTWMNFLGDSRHSQDLINATRDELGKRLRTWSWIPDAQQDKMWPTKKKPLFTRWPQSSAAAPRILLNAGVVPVFVTVEDGVQVYEIE